MRKVIITIEDGMLTGVLTAPGEEVDVELIDYDNIAATTDEDEYDQLKQDADAVEKKVESGKLVNCW